jgi:phosphoadenosine phosphosulfate reductase
MTEVAAARDPAATIAWALDAFPGRVALTVSFGGGGLVLAHLLSRLDPTVPVLFLDTGFHFPETLAFKDEFVRRYGLNLIELQPATDPGPLYQTDPDACCRIRKVEPLERALHGFDAWISAVRKDQGPSRAAVEVVEQHEVDGRSITKIFPLAHWTRADVAHYLEEHHVAHHPLLDQGYTSIGCWPCTRPTGPGESERDGRWSGTTKRECGLHTFTVKRS